MPSSEIAANSATWLAFVWIVPGQIDDRLNMMRLEHLPDEVPRELAAAVDLSVFDDAQRLGINRSRRAVTCWWFTAITPMNTASPAMTQRTRRRRPDFADSDPSGALRREAPASSPAVVDGRSNDADFNCKVKYRRLANPTFRGRLGGPPYSTVRRTESRPVHALRTMVDHGTIRRSSSRLRGSLAPWRIVSTCTFPASIV